MVWTHRDIVLRETLNKADELGLTKPETEELVKLVNQELDSNEQASGTHSYSL